jgi:hypothetical protein
MDVEFKCGNAVIENVA